MGILRGNVPITLRFMEEGMITTKRVLLVGVIVLQTVLIILLGFTAINFRNDGIKARAEARHYHSELKMLHEEYGAVLTRTLVKRETI